MRASCDRIDIDKQKTISQTLRFPYNARVYIMRASYDSIDNKLKQAQRRAAMDRRMHCIIPNESYNINHNITIRHGSFKYALHIHDVIYEGAF